VVVCKKSQQQQQHHASKTNYYYNDTQLHNLFYKIKIAKKLYILRAAAVAVAAV
jgi:hypothetical protein